MNFNLKNIRKNIITYSYLQGGHLGGSLSAVEILHTLYSEFYNNKKNNIIVSKGHSAIGVYCVLECIGLMDKATLETYCLNNSKLIGHVNSKIKGISYSSGALGNGLGVGLGMALSDKFFFENENVYVVLSDGELNEGSTMEAIQFAGHNKVENLIAILDKNNIQASNFTKNIIDTDLIISAIDKLGWEVIVCENGNDVESIKKAVLKKSKDKPTLIVCHTKKGCGISFIENDPSWHHRQLTEQEYQNAIKELL